MARDVARQEQRIDMVPERVPAVHQRGVQFVRHLHSSLAGRANWLRRDAKNFRQLCDVDEVATRQPHRLLNDVLQLAHVTWPAISTERFHRPRREAGAPMGTRDEVIDEHGYFVPALT